MDHLILDGWELSEGFSDEDAFVIEVAASWKMFFNEAAHRQGAGVGVTSLALKVTCCHIHYVNGAMFKQCG